jgi:hypothetical protein
VSDSRGVIRDSRAFLAAWADGRNSDGLVAEWVDVSGTPPARDFGHWPPEDDDVPEGDAGVGA